MYPWSNIQTNEGTLYMETPNVILQSPNGDDKVLVGNTYPIQWTSGTAMGISAVRLEYSIDNGQNWNESGYSLPECPYCITSDGNGKWMVGANTVFLYYSTDPLQTWTQIESPVSSSRINAIATDGNGIWVAGDYDGNMIYSTDGISFLQGTSGTTDSIQGIATDGNGYWIAVAESYFAQYTDGNIALWESLETGTGITSHHGGVATDGNGAWVAAGTGWQLSFSPDKGATWTDASGISYEIHGVTAY